MNLKPVLPIWILVPLCVTVIVFCVLELRKQKKRIKQIHWIVRTVLVFLLLVIGLRPGISSGTTDTLKNNLDVFVLFDRSGSMLAEDYQGDKPRIDGAKADMKALGENLSGAKFSIITFSHYAQQFLPLTDNVDAFTSGAESIAPQLTTYSRGSSIDSGIDLLKERLKKHTEKYNNERIRAIVYVGDGEQTSDQKPKSFAELEKLSDSALVLGYGTPSGARMREYSPYSKEVRYVYNYDTNSDAISKYNEENLQKIASELGGTFAHRTASGGMEDLSNRLLASARQIESDDDQGGRFEFYWIFAIIACLLTFFELAQLIQIVSSVKSMKETV